MVELVDDVEEVVVDVLVVLVEVLDVDVAVVLETEVVLELLLVVEVLVVLLLVEDTEVLLLVTLVVLVAFTPQQQKTHNFECFLVKKGFNSGLERIKIRCVQLYNLFVSM